MLNTIMYHLEVFKITWLRPSAYTNRFMWHVVEPIKTIMYCNGLLRDKPLRMEIEELNAEMHKDNK